MNSRIARVAGTFGAGRRRLRGDGRSLVLVAGLAAAVVAGGLVPVPTAAASVKPKAPSFQPSVSVPVKAVTSHYRKPARATSWQAPATRWPSGRADAVLPVRPTAVQRTASPPMAAGTLPVSIAAAAVAKGSTSAAASGPVHVDVAGRSAATAAGVNGVLLSLSAGTSQGAHPVEVTLDYRPFEHAFGGDWASRLHLVQLPACAVSTPTVASCRAQTPLRFTHAAQTSTVRASVALPAPAPVSTSSVATATSAQATVVLAATAAASGGGGDYGATSLKASGSWQAGGSSDAFAWSYPIDVPQVPGGLIPQVALSYDSQSQDGLTSSTNNQASWVGDGWDYSPGYMERSYASCHDNPAGTTRTWDTCWSGENTLTLSLNGSTTTVIKDDTTGTFRAQSDSNEKVEHLTGATNGAQGGEYWRITTTDGTQYYFGKNHLPGWATGNATTNSVWTEPVFATASGQPCYNSTFASSWCQQAYRWNLDYVVDPHDDAVSYFYTNETNAYSRNLGATANTTYVRGGYLSKIQYGQRDGAVYSSTPAGEVDFTVNGRCNTSPTGCAVSTLTKTTASKWPDLPYDLNCASATACLSQSPSFWSEYELTGIQTKALVGTTLTNVDSWALKHTFPATGDSTTPSLWLSTITHTGQDTTAGGSSAAITLPTVTFTGTPLSNRVNLTNGYPPITRHRLTKITTETGAIISVNYSAPACATSTPAVSTNTARCYPAYWTPTGVTNPMLDWFNKFIVTAVTQQDPTGGTANDTISTTYTPVGGAAWRHDDNPLIPAAQRTWNQWRGYQGMIVSTGTAPDPISKTQYVYFRGMDGDTLPTGTRSVTVTNLRGDTPVTDAEQYAGMTYEQRVFNGSAVVTDTITDPWTSPATATHDPSGSLPARHAFIVGSAGEGSYTPLASGGTRSTRTDYTHDSLGRLSTTDDQGDTSITSDDLCSTTTYADNTSKWILDAPDRTTTVSLKCSGTPNLPGDAVSDTRTFYDGSTTFGAAPSAGDVTMTQKAATYTGSTPTYVTLSTATVDQYGRTTAATDADAHKTSTVYTPATGAEPTTVVLTDPMSLVTTTTMDPLRRLPLSVTDPGGYVTTQRYDALGRRTAVYQPGHNAANSSALPNLKYTYTVSATGPSVVNTYTLNEDDTYRVSETLYDALLRARETQTETPDGGRNIADTMYNTTGQQSETTAPYFNTAPVSTTYVEAQVGQVPSATGYVYDNAGRRTAQIAYALGTETWRTSYLYGGNFTTTVPPKGAPATTAITDARGRTTDQYVYHSGVTADPLAAARSDYTRTASTFYPNDLKASSTDDAGNTWAWQYNLLGQQTQAKDPDAGTSTSTYDHAGQLLTATDARGQQITTTYDSDGRTTATYDTSTTSTLSSTNKLTARTYDTIKKGYPTASTSYSGGDTVTQAVLGYNLYAKTSAVRTTITGESTALIPAAGLVTSFGYTSTGRLNGQLNPAAGGLLSEDISYGASAFGQPTSLVSPASFYVQAVGYSEAGQPLQYTMPTDTSTLYRTLTYDPQTQALTSTQATGSAGVLDRTTYGYANSSVSAGAGLLVSATNQQDGGASTDTQCYRYDDAARLAQAWSATDACAATPSASASSTVGGPVAPYWQSWTYDNAGDRATQTDHSTSGSTANDTTSTYHYPTAGGSQPHTLTSSSATGPAASAYTAGYEYDESGNTTKITGGATGDQTLAWNTQGKLATATTAAGVSSYVYDADGTLVIRRDPGTVTFFYGDQEYVLTTATGVVTGTRSYSLNGQVIAQRSSSGLVQFLFADRLGTGGLAVSSKDQSLTRRQYLPFGGVRGPPAIGWLGSKGYLGSSTDPTTTFTHLGAREYDATSGRFLSLDPVLELGDPTQMGGYDYSGNDPITHSDPSGLFIPIGDDQPAGSTHRPDQPDTGNHQPGHTPPSYGHCTCPSHTSPGHTSSPTRAQPPGPAWLIPKPPLAFIHVTPGNHPAQHHSHGGGFLMNAAIIGVGLIDIAQLGLDPVTDGLELALIGTDMAATGAEEAAALAIEEEGTALAEGANGALRDPATGRFAENPAKPPARIADSTHGNSRSSDAVTHLYRRVGNDGGFKKWGITNNLMGRYSSNELGGDQLIRMTSGTRSNMLNLERWLVEIDPGPMNMEPWAGAVP